MVWCAGDAVVSETGADTGALPRLRTACGARGRELLVLETDELDQLAVDQQPLVEADGFEGARARNPPLSSAIEIDAGLVDALATIQQTDQGAGVEQEFGGHDAGS